MYYDALPQETIDYIRSYRDHISLAAGEGEPLATQLYAAHTVLIMFPGQPAIRHFMDSVDAYRAAVDSAPGCDCGDEHTMPNYRVCHPCRLGRLIYPHLFEMCAPDALFEVPL